VTSPLTPLSGLDRLAVGEDGDRQIRDDAVQADACAAVRVGEHGDPSPFVVPHQADPVATGLLIANAIHLAVFGRRDERKR
jgi:hypothetical protein